MPQVWKISRYQPSVFQQKQPWRRSLHGLGSLLWALFWIALALWIIVGGVESRQIISGILRALVHFIRDAFYGLTALLR